MQAAFEALVTELALGDPDEIQSLSPLTGGVASDIMLVELTGRKLCIKCALEKLKVEEDWHAPVHRNRAEYAWLEFAAAINPDGAVKLLGRSDKRPCFAMEYLEGADTYLWKAALLGGCIAPFQAERVGHSMGKIHAASTASGFDRTPFNNHKDFYALRLDPYLNFTARQHPALRDTMAALVTLVDNNSSVLVHGDISPKNIIFRRGAPIILDAECASMGDPAFDVAFCLNHLLLKAVHLGSNRAELLNAVSQLWQAYASHVCWESATELEVRVTALLPALMLARVDGKSPVEYLTPAAQKYVRETSIPVIRQPFHRLNLLIDYVQKTLEDTAL